VKIVHAGSVDVGVYNCDGELHAIEDRCSHDDGPLCEGEWEPEECVVICPRHGSRFDVRSGKPLTLPAYLPVDTYPVHVVDGVVKVDV
jgi:3-phenylpropionate/trans-cinnamate dioxygenase ferredoxin subunit